MLLLIATKWSQIGTRKLQYCLICCIGPFLQILYLLSGLAEDSHPGKRVGGLFHNVFETCYTYIQNFLYFFADFNKNVKNTGLFLNILIGLVLLLILLKLITLHKDNRSLFSISLFLWGLGITFSNAITGRMAQTIDQSAFLSATSYTSGRGEFLVYVGILFFCIMVISDHFLVIYDLKWKKIILSIVLILCVCRFSKNMLGSTEFETRTNWRQFASMLDEPEYAIPVIERDSFITQNADVFYYGQRKLGESKVRQSSRVVSENQIDKMMISLLDVGDTIKDRKVISIYTKKLYISQPNEIYVLLFNKNGDVLAYSQGIIEYDRSLIGFQFEEKVYDVSHVGFYCSKNGMPYEVRPEIFIAVSH